MVETTRTITISGTANQVISSAGAQSLAGNRTWTLSLPQDIATTSTPTFGGLTINGSIGIRAAATATAATQIPVFISDPTSTTQTLVTRTPTQLRSDIGSTTVGGNLFTLANPSAIRFIRINADNTVSALSDSDFRTAIGAGTSSSTGTVTSIATNNGVTGGTITSTGTIGLTGQALALHNLASNGLIIRTGSGTVAARTITGTASQITVTNGDGVSGNPTISLPSTINVDTTGVATTSLSIRSQDTRATASTPETANSSSGIRFDFKQNSTNGLADGGTYNGVMYWRAYGSSTDFSGGPAFEIANTANGNLWLRSGTSTTWGAWKQIVDSANTLSISGTKTFSTTPVFSEATATLSFSSATGAKTISTGGSTDLFLNPGGNVRIGTAGTSVAAKLQVGGDIRATGEVVAYAASDKNLKDNIQKIESPLEIISKISGYTFDWNNKQETYIGKDYGVIAQEIEEVMPELVITRESGYKAVNYEKIIPLLIESIKEQQNTIVSQQTEIKELRELINNISNK